MYKYLALLVGIIACVFLVKRYGDSSYTYSLPPLPQDPDIQVYFNQNQAKNAEYVEPYRQFKRQGDDLEKIIIEQINSANSTIDLAVQELNLSNLAQALIKKQKEGIKVRIVIENTYNPPENTLPSSHGLRLLKQAKISLIDDTEDGTKGSGLMHHKFMVIDEQKVITGSANFTLSDVHGDFDQAESRGNANHLLVINSPELAQVFTQEFNYLWGDGVGNKKNSLFGVKKPFREGKIISLGNNIITVKFSPTSKKYPYEKTTNGLINETLTKANKAIDLALFVFSEQKIADILEQESQTGVKIRALIDPNFAFQYYSEGLDLLGVALGRNCSYEKDNNPWEKSLKTVGIPTLPEGDKLHHKFAVIDNLTIITGSHNWSISANNTNDETLLIINNPLITQHFDREFNRLYSQAKLGIPDHINNKIEQEQSQCNLN